MKYYELLVLLMLFFIIVFQILQIVGEVVYYAVQWLKSRKSKKKQRKRRTGAGADKFNKQGGFDNKYESRIKMSEKILVYQGEGKSPPPKCTENRETKESQGLSLSWPKIRGKQLKRNKNAISPSEKTSLNEKDDSSIKNMSKVGSTPTSGRQLSLMRTLGRKISMKLYSKLQKIKKVKLRESRVNKANEMRRVFQI